MCGHHMTIKPLRFKGKIFKLKTKKNIEDFFLNCEEACRCVWNRFRFLNKERLYRGWPILRYHEMAFWLKWWKQSDELSWLATVPSQILQQTLMDLDRTYRDAFDKKQPGKRLPRFKKRQDSIGIRFPQGFLVDNRRIKFPKIGWVFQESGNW